MICASSRAAAVAADYRAEHGRQVDVFAADGADCVDGADGVLCGGAAGEIADYGPDFYADWGERQSGAGTVDIFGGDERGGGDFESRDAVEFGAAG